MCDAVGELDAFDDAGQPQRRRDRQQRAVLERLVAATHVSPQYLNDIEHDRRSPSSGHLIRQFSGILNIPEDYLYALAGRLPDDLRPDASTPDKVVEAFANFRKTLKE